MKRLLLLYVVVGAAACDGGGPEVDCEITCETNQMRLQGTLGGESVDVTRSLELFMFMNAGVGDEAGRLQLGWGGGATPAESVELRFDELLADGGTTEARGSVKLTSGATLDVGNCESGEASSALRKGEGDGQDTFQLEGLHEAPYCSGAAVSGKLCGCARQEPFGS